MNTRSTTVKRDFLVMYGNIIFHWAPMGPALCPPRGWDFPVFTSHSKGRCATLSGIRPGAFKAFSLFATRSRRGFKNCDAAKVWAPRDRTRKREKQSFFFFQGEQRARRTKKGGKNSTRKRQREHWILIWAYYEWNEGGGDCKLQVICVTSWRI